MQSDNLIFHSSKLIQMTSVGMCVLDDQQRIEYCNDAMSKIFGFATSEEMVNLSYVRLLAGEQQPHFLLSEVSQPDSLPGERILLTRNDGSIFWGHVDCKPFFHQEKASFYLIIKDVSGQIKKEEFVRTRTAALEKVSAEFDRFMYSASHDLRAPISTIMGLVNLFKLEQDQGAHTQLLKLMEDSLNKMENVIQKLTYFSRNKTQRKSKTKINFRKIVAGIHDRMSNHPNFCRIEFKSQLDSLSSPFYSSRFRIELILEEVIKNAYEFHDLTKPDPYVSIVISQRVNEVQIVVEDNGRGIASTYTSSVFDMFFRASTRSHGSGMGLFIAREAVDKISGNIYLKSQLGQGTKVTIVLPVVSEWQHQVAD